MRATQIGSCYPNHPTQKLEQTLNHGVSATVPPHLSKIQGQHESHKLYPNQPSQSVIYYELL